MKAIASITFDDAFVVREIRVIEGQNGLFVAMPSRKTPTGEFKDIAHPINADARQLIQNAILEEYEKPNKKTGKLWLLTNPRSICYNRLCLLGRRQAVRHGTLTPACVGSNPAAPAILLRSPLENSASAEFFLSFVV